MQKFFSVLLIALLTGCSTTTYYISRHAEKASPGMGGSTDVPLTEKGAQHAQALATTLQNKNLLQVWSTPFVRTQATAQPTASLYQLPIRNYAAGNTAVLDSVRSLKSGAVLIVGHSNTVDDLVNRLMNKQVLQDLPDSQYGDLFIVKRRGNKFSFSQQKIQ